jgi:hypothetical protein
VHHTAAISGKSMAFYLLLSHRDFIMPPSVSCSAILIFFPAFYTWLYSPDALEDEFMNTQWHPHFALRIII